MKKKIVLTGLCLLFIAGLFCYRIAVRTPPYPGRLVLDLTNNTWSEISGSFLCFENTNVRSVLPDIFPQERLILLAPTDIFDRPQKTQVFLEYNGKRYTLSDEYYFLNGDKWNTDVVQSAKAVFSGGSVKTSDEFWADYQNIKPYFRVIDMDTL